MSFEQAHAAKAEQALRQLRLFGFFQTNAATGSENDGAHRDPKARKYIASYGGSEAWARLKKCK